jgi:hypothetical protein
VDERRGVLTCSDYTGIESFLVCQLHGEHRIQLVNTSVVGTHDERMCASRQRIRLVENERNVDRVVRSFDQDAPVAGLQAMSCIPPNGDVGTSLRSRGSRACRTWLYNPRFRERLHDESDPESDGNPRIHPPHHRSTGT